MELLAQTVDAIRANSYYLLKVNGNDPDAPDRIPRPGSREPVAMGSLADFNALIEG